MKVILGKTNAVHSAFENLGRSIRLLLTFRESESESESESDSWEDECCAFSFWESRQEHQIAFDLQ